MYFSGAPSKYFNGWNRCTCKRKWFASFWELLFVLSLFGINDSRWQSLKTHQYKQGNCLELKIGIRKTSQILKFRQISSCLPVNTFRMTSYCFWLQSQPSMKSTACMDLKRDLLLSCLSALIRDLNASVNLI